MRVLTERAPHRPLNERFLEIVHDGTGRQFSLEDNAAWPRMARPIVEAFFHARFFLEMAVRYAPLESPPAPLPSGCAALLYICTGFADGNGAEGGPAVR